MYNLLAVHTYLAKLMHGRLGIRAFGKRLPAEMSATGHHLVGRGTGRTRRRRCIPVSARIVTLAAAALSRSRSRC